MKVVILAGGLGTRITEESYMKPKPMVEIGDAPILWHIMKYYSSFGYDDFIICCGYKGYVIKEYFANYYLHLSDITFDFTKENEMIVHNNVAEPWKVTLVDTGLNAQTGARIHRIEKYIGNNAFMLTYGDGLSDIDLRSLVKFHQCRNNVVTLSAVQMGSKFGVLDFYEDDTTIRCFSEKAKEDGGWINAGFMVVEPEIFNYLSDDDALIFEQQPLRILAHEGKLGAYRHNGFWQCMDTIRERNILEEKWKTGKAPWKIWN